jgi:putative ABC transport system substrate-binding protein
MTVVSGQLSALSESTGAKLMSRKIFIWLLATFFLATVSPAHSQQATKIHRIGYLDGVSLSAIEGRIEAFRQGLRDLGYAEGKNIIIEWRSAEGKAD